MKLTTKQISEIIAGLDLLDSGLQIKERKFDRINTKLSKELLKRGYTTIISKSYLTKTKKNNEV